MKQIKTVLAMALFASMAFGTLTVTGCEDQGPAERAGERIDEAGEEVKDAVEDATD